MNTNRTTTLAAMCVAAAALAASAAWADSVEDTNAAVLASWSDDGEITVVGIVRNSDMATFESYRISLGGGVHLPDPPELWGKHSGPWELGSTTIVVGDAVYRVTALHGEPPRVEDVGIRVGIVWEGGLPYALTYSHETGLNGTMWNVTGGMSPVEPHQYGLLDAEWGPNPGYAHLMLNGTRHAVVYAAYDNVKFPNRPPETASNISYNEPFERPVLVRIGNHDADIDGRVEADGNSERLAVGHGGTDYHFYDTGGVAIEAPLPEYDEPLTLAEAIEYIKNPPDKPLYYTSGAYVAQGSPMVVISIDGEKYAVVATADGPPALVDAAGAAALGMGDIRYMTPKDYIRWDMPADAPPTEGTIMEVTGLRSAHGGGDRTYFGFTVRNVHHEPLSIYIDRAAAAGHSLYHADVVVEQSHPYSSFDTPFGAIRLSGEYLGGHFGPSKAYPKGDIPYKKPLGYGNYDTGVHRNVNTVYSNEKLGRVFAYVEAPVSIWLEPGQSMRSSITLYSPCLYREESSIWTDNACGIGGPSLDKYNLEFDHVELVLVADGYPEWAVATYVEQACDRWGCEAEAVTTHVVHIDDVCEGARCDSRP